MATTVPPSERRSNLSAAKRLLLERQLRGERVVVSKTPPIYSVTRPAKLPLSYAQERLWFLAQLAPDNAFFNVPVALRLEGNLDVQALASAINQVVDRHETLRTCFPNTNGSPEQFIRANWKPQLRTEDLSELTEDKRRMEVRRLA